MVHRVPLMDFSFGVLVPKSIKYLSLSASVTVSES